MRPLLLAPLLLLLLLAGTRALCPSELPSAIDEILSHPNWTRAFWGVDVLTEYEPGNWTRLYSLNNQKFFIPASNNKLITTTAFLTSQGELPSFIAAALTLKRLLFPLPNTHI